MRRGVILAAILVPAPLLARGVPVAFEGAPPGLENALRVVSTVASADRRLGGEAAVRRAARNDAKAVAEALHSAGYYRASVTTRAEKGRVVFLIEAGPLFVVSGVSVAYTDVGDAGRPQTLDAAGVAGPLAPDGARLAELQQQFLNRLWESGYPSARIVSRHVDADFDAGTARAAFVFESGPRASFGDIAVEGARQVEPEFVTALRPFETGDVYQRSRLVKYRDRLTRSGLFGTVDVAPGAVTDGAAPVVVRVEERKARSFGLGVSYSTVEGPGGRVFLEHRNAFGRGERAFLELEGSKVRQSIGVEVSRPLPRENGSVFASGRFSNEPTAAFVARTASAAAGVVTQMADDRLELRGAVGLESSSVRSLAEDRRTYFVSLPVSATWNSEDDILDPGKGVRAILAVTPTTGTDSFVRVDASARSRLRFGPDDRLTAAGRVRLGATAGVSVASLPANRRLYAGGGASVRGYGYQAVGPRDVNGDPEGGLSAFESAVELRARAVGRIEIAAFLDAGSVYRTPWPDFSEKLFLGAGAGLRYRSPAGPIRVDVATPLNGFDSDRRFQIYISLGQPF